MIRDIYERIRDSLFLIPATIIVGLALLSVVALSLDNQAPDGGAWWLLATTVDSARAILSTVATATITVAAIVFSMTAVVVQLATSQFSPRVTQGFLRDRYQQVTIGLTVGTFVYALIVLSTVRGSEEGPATTHDISVTGALILAVVSMIAIVSFIDRIMRSMRIDTIVRRLSDVTERAVADLPAPEKSEIEATSPPDTATVTTIGIEESGWVTRIRVDSILSALPPSTSVRIELKVGDFMADGEPLATVWPEVDDAIASRIRSAVDVSRVRSIHRDPAYGVRQMVDIALRALSPALNDATTGADVVHHLSGPIRAVLLRDLPGRVRSGSDDRRVYLPRSLTHSDYVHLAFQEIRINALDQPHVLRALLETLSSLIGIVERAGHEGRAGSLRHEAVTTLDVVRACRMPDRDKEMLIDFARTVGITPEDQSA